MALTLDFVFEGFRLIRKKPSLILSWGVFYLLIAVVSVVLLFLISGTGFMAYQAMVMSAAQTGVQPSPAAMGQVMAGLLPGYLAMIPISLIGAAMIQNAVFRASMKPQDGGFGYLKLGDDEWRQLGLMIILFFVSIGVFLIIGIAASVLIYAVSLIPVEFVSGLGKVVVILAAIFAWVGFGVRMSLSGPLAFDTKKLNLFGSLKLTKGHGWTLFFGYLIMVILLFVSIILIEIAFVIVMLLVVLVAAMSGGLDMAQLNNMQHANLAIIIPAALVCILLYVGMFFLMTSLMYAVIFGAPAAAYKMLTAKPAEPAPSETAVPASPDSL